MKWSRTVAAAAAGLILCGCTGTGGSGKAPSTAPSARAVGNSASPAPSPSPTVSLILNGQTDARPGERVHMMLYGVTRARGGDAVTARSAALTGPVRLSWEDDHYWAVGTLKMTNKPGSYPLTVAVHGRDVARDTVKVAASQRPSFTLSASREATRPGEPVWLSFDDLYPGERGTGFTVRSAALPAPVRLVHDDDTDFYNPRAFSARPELRTRLADGTYTFTLYSADGRRIAEKRLTVRASRPGDRDYRGKPSGPEFFDPGAGYSDGSHNMFRAVAGGRVAVMWHDVYPDPGEETRLTATSPAFTGTVRLRHDDSKGADGDDPRFLGTATVRPGLAPGRYPVTVVAHHGRVKKTAYLTVTAR
ncbi:MULTISPECIES: hypothetical protein [unclassified Streptomyces]|uniref:hypothetical protein n=1 Tax=unclassified Streptomyces TaxID=2593676 RepID=UPI000DD7D645|nr:MULTISPECIES: hypothetical protein [unclassified Streptomyces]QZZ31687.1 hypothetical protein A7X85_40620 [Streptomyces sp. ST1015]